MARSSFRRILYSILVPGILAGLVFLWLASFRAGPPPTVTIEPGLPGIGRNTPIQIGVDEPTRGLAGFTVELVQDDRVELLEDRSYVPRRPWDFWGERVAREDLAIEVGSDTVEGLREGEATLRVVAQRAPSWFRRPEPETVTRTLPVKLRPPSIHVQSSQTNVAQGGSEAVVYRVGETAVRDGVRAGDAVFPGYPLPGGGPRDRFVLFAVPWNLDNPDRVELFATDDVGNEARASFLASFNRKDFRNRRINVGDDFINRVVPAILAETPDLRDKGNPLDNYLQINGELRNSNARTLAELGAASRPEFLWDGPFLPMRNAQLQADFADGRIYVYDGQDVDQQVHLGVDLASTAQAEIEAANGGVVVLARYFGIYGNTVVIDHGYGLQSLYGHLSSVGVDEGQEVERGQLVGRSGATGLAGGDHLHFTMLLHGVPVNPREWWDAGWIRNRLEPKLGAARASGG